jgi:hypothetical protein
VGPTTTRRSGSKRRVEPMTRSAFTFILLTETTGTLLVMADPSRWI